MASSPQDGDEPSVLDPHLQLGCFLSAGGTFVTPRRVTQSQSFFSGFPGGGSARDWEASRATAASGILPSRPLRSLKRLSASPIARDSWSTLRERVS